MTTTALVGSQRVRLSPVADRADQAAAITWEASKQSYFTIRFLVDRDRVGDAYRAYGYFRWVDDRIDEGALTPGERVAFVRRQSDLLTGGYRGEGLPRLRPEEAMLLDLIRDDDAPDSGLRAYLYYMMAVMAFDADRRGKLMSQAELEQYTHWLAVAVTESLHHHIGHDDASPHDETRYAAATGAHIAHMLRDMLDDLAAGYINIPREVIEETGIAPDAVDHPAFRAWVRAQVEAARECFRQGRDYLARVENPRCRMAGYAYIARFESVLDAIERDGYRLRAAYPERKSLRAKLNMGWSVLAGSLRQAPQLELVR